MNLVKWALLSILYGFFPSVTVEWEMLTMTKTGQRILSKAPDSFLIVLLVIHSTQIHSFVQKLCFSSKVEKAQCLRANLST